MIEIYVIPALNHGLKHRKTIGRSGAHIIFLRQLLLPKMNMEDGSSQAARQLRSTAVYSSSRLQYQVRATLPQRYYYTVRRRPSTSSTFKYIHEEEDDDGGENNDQTLETRRGLDEKLKLVEWFGGAWFARSITVVRMQRGAKYAKRSAVALSVYHRPW